MPLHQLLRQESELVDTNLSILGSDKGDAVSFERISVGWIIVNFIDCVVGVAKFFPSHKICINLYTLHTVA